MFYGAAPRVRSQQGCFRVRWKQRDNYACTVLAIEAQGSEIVTIEGLGTPDRMHELQSAFVENDARTYPHESA